MINVLSLVPYPFLPARTGGQKAIAQFYKYFSRETELTCIGVRANDADYADGYTLIRLLSRSPLRYINPFLFFKVRRLLKETHADFLLLEHPYYGWLGWALKSTTRIRLIVRSHNIEGNRWKSLGKWWWPILWHYEKFTHRQADYNIFIQDEERKYAIRHFGLAPASCVTMTFGVERESAPLLAEKATAREVLNVQFGLDPQLPILLINGAFQYAPNRQALEDLLFQINPLLNSRGLRYQLLVCGMDIPVPLSSASFPSVKMLGFVEDLSLLLTGADLFVNPVVLGGGIKTKLVEALSFGLNAVSTESGAIGIDPVLCNGKLRVVPGKDGNGFASAIEEMLGYSAETPAIFFDHFSWKKLAAYVAAFVEEK